MPLSESGTAATGGTSFVPLRMLSPVEVEARTTASTIADANSNRRGVTVFNSSDGNLYIDYVPSVSAESFMVKIAPGAYWEAPYGCMDSLWGVFDVTEGAAQVRQFLKR